MEKRVTDNWEKKRKRFKRGEEARLHFCTIVQVRVSLTSVISIVNHLFLIGIEFGEDWDGFEN